MKFFKRILFLCIAVALLLPVFVLGDTGTVATTVSIIHPGKTSIDLRAVPEKRIANVTAERINNRATSFRLSVYAEGADRTDDNNRIYTTTTVWTDDNGRNTEILIDNLTTTTAHDFIVKSYAHLSKLLASKVPGNHIVLDFTDSGNAPLLSGDINSTEGDNKINAIDIGLLVDQWGNDHARADLNQDDVVNSIDISNLLNNFNEVGE